MTTLPVYDVVIVGGGHNGLVAACYLGLAGKRVLVLEKNNSFGGATQSKRVFSGMDARLSVYSYLISLLPEQILTDLRLRLEVRRRMIASYTPVERNGQHHGLLISNVSEADTRESFLQFYGDSHEYRSYQKLDEMLLVFAQKVWPTLFKPLPSKQALQKTFRSPEERKIWDYLVEKPLSALIEDYLSDDIVRGAVFTDAKIGVLTHPDDASLLQNRTFLYHVIGQGTGEWRVPVGGMGALVDALIERAHSAGVVLKTSTEVLHVEHTLPKSAIVYHQDGKEAAVEARYVLFNVASNVANRILPGVYAEQQVEGSVLKLNMLLKRLPRLKASGVSPRDAFTGTFHIDEGYENMKNSYRRAVENMRIDSRSTCAVPAEMYCHSLTDASILSPELQRQGYHTLTLFGLDTPYHWFEEDNTAVTTAIAEQTLRSMNAFLEEDVFDCLALDADGEPCLEAMSPVDLEEILGLPKGNIFHGNLTWPFAESDDEIGMWGVETPYEHVLMCGSSAKRGGAVSGLPGHHAAMKVLEL